jgi:hypothetical protein
MFEGLDSLDWVGIGTHVYGNHHLIPQMIRNLVAEDASKRKDAADFLFGEGQDLGSIYDTTPLLIPFALEVISANPDQDQAYLLNHFAAISGNRLQLSHSLHQLKIYAQTYVALEKGIEIYVNALANSEHHTRWSVIYILGRLSDQAEQVLPSLIDHFSRETNEIIQISLLEAIENCLSEQDYRKDALLRTGLPFLLEVIDQSNSWKIRIAATFAYTRIWLSTSYHKLIDLPSIAAVLGQALEQLDNLHDEDQLYRKRMIRSLAALSPELLIPLLSKQTSPAKAHLIGHALLDGRLNQDWFWAASTREKQGQYKSYSKSILIPRKIAAIRAIVENDKFWELPTNLFSFFYGLPDSREALRQLVEDGQSTARDSDPNG